MSWRHLEDTTPMARKPHRCILCELPIPAGERHVRRVGTDEDGIVSSRMHLECEDITKDWDEDDWLCTDPSDFRDLLAESRRQPNPTA